MIIRINIFIWQQGCVYVLCLKCIKREDVYVYIRKGCVLLLPAIIACLPAPSPDLSFALAFLSASVRIARRISAIPIISSYSSYSLQTTINKSNKQQLKATNNKHQLKAINNKQQSKAKGGKGEGG